jgi:hypothetical protein
MGNYKNIRSAFSKIIVTLILIFVFKSAHTQLIFEKSEYVRRMENLMLKSDFI